MTPQCPSLAPVVRLNSLAVAVPAHELLQEDVAAQCIRLFGIEKLAPIYRNAGIRKRYACTPLAWFLEPHGLAERNDLFLDHAVALMARAARKALFQGGLEAGDIDAVVVVTTTGIATPALDARLMSVLSLRPDIRRAPLFGLGCAGGVIGLARAADMARARPGERVLLLAVDLCTLAFLAHDRSRSNMAATALFGDGAAACVLSCREDAGGPILGASHEQTWPAGPEVMDWDFDDGGLKPRFSRDLPATIRETVGPVALDFLTREGLSPSRLAGFACHPGGVRVVEALEAAFDLPPGGLRHTRRVLRDYGNMSVGTVLFVLRAVLDESPQGPVLLTAMGPGFTAGFMLVHA